jgi:hypothetical protein
MTDRMAFGMMINQLGLHGEVTWEKYQRLPRRGILVVDYGIGLGNGTRVRVVNGSL